MCTYEVEDKSTNGVQSVLKLLQHFFPYAQKQLGFHKPVMISFESDEENSNKLLGRTGHYNPDDFSIGIYVDGRHPKDVLRSLSHELIHHTQNCNGEFDAMENLGPGYAQDNPAMRDAELDAYKRGNIIFRDFEDLIKKGEIVCDIDFEELGEPRMSLKEWKNNELNMLLLKKWGLLKEGGGGRDRWLADGDKEHDDEEGNRPSMAKDMDLDEQDDPEAVMRRVRGRGRREDLYEGEEELQEWNPFKPKVSGGTVTPGGSQGAYAETGGRGGTPGAAIPQADKTKIAAATTQGSGETAAKDVKDIADSAVTGRREDEDELKEVDFVKGAGSFNPPGKASWSPGHQRERSNVLRRAGYKTDPSSGVSTAPRVPPASSTSGGGGYNPAAAVDADKAAGGTGAGAGGTAGTGAVGFRREDGKERGDERGNRPSFAKKMGLDESEEELTRWHELAGLNEQDEDDEPNAARIAWVDPDSAENQQVRRGSAKRARQRSAGDTSAGDRISAASRDELGSGEVDLTGTGGVAGYASEQPPHDRFGKQPPTHPYQPKNVRESITIDEARDVARRIFEKLSEGDQWERSVVADDRADYGAYAKGGGGRVVAGGSTGQRARDYALMGLDPSQAPIDVEVALYKAERDAQKAAAADARGGGRVVRGGSQSARAKAAERQGIDISMEPESAGLRQHWDTEEEKARAAARPRRAPIPPELDPGRPAGSVDVRMSDRNRRRVREALVNKIRRKRSKETK